MLFQFKYTIQFLWSLTFITFLWLGAGYNVAGEESSVAQEYQVKATFLMRFGKYVNYPEPASSDSQPVFTLCVLGDDPFQGALDMLTKDEMVKDRAIVVNYLRDLEKTNSCQTLFISASEEKQLFHILTRVKQRPILTVSDMDNFVIRGGMIQFYMLDNKVRFFIDPVTASEAKLELSSRLLQIAKVVRKQGE